MTESNPGQTTSEALTGLSDRAPEASKNVDIVQESVSPTRSAGSPRPHFDPQRFARQFVEEQLSAAIIRNPKAPTTAPVQMGSSSDESGSDPVPSAEEPVSRTASLPENGSSPDLSPVKAASRSSSRAKENVVCEAADLNFRPQIHIAGFNSALNRTAHVAVTQVPLLGKLLPTTKWTPFWGRVPTFGITFPEGFEFLPPKPERPAKASAEGTEAGGERKELTAADLMGLVPKRPAEGAAVPGTDTADPSETALPGAMPPETEEDALAQEELQALAGILGAVGQEMTGPAGLIGPSTADSVEIATLTEGTASHQESALAPTEPIGLGLESGEQAASTATEKRTRFKPPHDAVSIEDRLFYLLQPPLETWLKGQELIMPFEPFPYQYEGIAWLFAQQAALLADEMGLGKTMQTITAMRLLLRAGQVNRILLVCPKPLIPNWQREFKNWAEELPVVTIEGDWNHRRMQWTMPGVPILLANYEILVRDFEALKDDPPKFDLLILDEAQRIKNRGSRTALTARGIPRRRSWALTGTPIENRPEEMASLYEFMEVIPNETNPDLRQLQRLSKSYVLRRTKDLVMKDLPPRFDREEFLELAPAQKMAYETAEKDGIVQLNSMGDSITVQHVFELVLRLKQITNFEPVTGESAKLERLEADMEEIAASGGKAILFSQWTKTIDYLERRLERFGPLVYHGRIPVKQREPILTRFKEDPSCPLLMMSYATGAVGLNLQFAGYVFLFDRWWNPAVEDQAINRAHRIGQKTQVIVTKFICKDTIEERIDRVLNEKRQLFAEVLGEGDNTNVSLSLNASEIFGLFDMKARHKGGTRSICPPPPPVGGNA